MGSSLQPSVNQNPVPAFAIRLFWSVVLENTSYLIRPRLSNFAFLALQIYLNLNALVFAVWNVGASRVAGAHGGPLLDLTSWLFDSGDAGSVSWRSVRVNNLQWHRDNPLYRLVRNLPLPHDCLFVHDKPTGL